MSTTRIELNLSDKEIDQLRQIVDWLPLARYATLICAIMAQLPLTESAAGTPSSADADPRTLTPSGSAGGFSLAAFTDSGKERLPDLLAMLARIPHGDSL